MTDQTKHYTDEEFLELAEKEFGKKFSYHGIHVSDENLTKFNQDREYHLTSEDFLNYKQIWLVENKCPNCGSPLGGLFGSFRWSLTHGVGYCSECKKVDFRLYHYIGDCKTPITAYSLIGF